MRRRIPFIPPALEGSGAWRAVNGPTRLARILRRWPDILPYVAVMSDDTDHQAGINVPAAADGETPSTARGTVSPPPDGDLYIFATSAGGYVGSGAVIGGASGGLPSVSGIAPDDYFGTVDVREERAGNRWSSAPILVGQMFGDGRMPYVLPAPFIIKGGSSVSATISYRGANANRLFLCFHGFRVMQTTPDLPVDIMMDPRLIETLRHYRQRAALGRVEPFFYSLNLDLTRQVPAVGFQTEQLSVTVSDADFIALDVMGLVQGASGVDPSSFVAGAIPFVPLCQDQTSVQLSIGSGETRLDGRPRLLADVSGTARHPYRLPRPLVIPAGTDLTAIFGDPGQDTNATSMQRDKFFAVAGVRVFRDERR